MLIHFHIQEGALYPLFVLYRIHVFIRHSFEQLKKNPTSYHVVVREFKTQ